MSQQTLPETGFLRLKDVLTLFPVSKSTWWAGVKDGRFPKPHKLSTRVSGWAVEDIRELIKISAGAPSTRTKGAA